MKVTMKGMPPASFVEPELLRFCRHRGNRCGGVPLVLFQVAREVLVADPSLLPDADPPLRALEALSYPEVIAVLAPGFAPDKRLKFSTQIADALFDKSLSAQLALDAPTTLDRLQQRLAA